ncbi:MAG: hypothetical protein FJ279_38260, partial [Planctomycetes bacterium]|nr:hypothetical protein [Planctomycetota bacterium]
MTPSQRILAGFVLGGCLWAATRANAADAPSAPPAAKPGVRIVDDLKYENADAAQTAWRAEEKRDAHGARIAQESVAPVQPLVFGGRPVLKLTCNFKDTTIARGVWDRRVALDLSLAAAISFDVYAQNLRAIGSAQLYLRSGDGWYGCKWYPKAEGQWNHIRLRKSHFYVDKPAAGWSKVETIRFSPWAMQREDATLYIANLGVEQSPTSALIL